MATIINDGGIAFNSRSLDVSNGQTYVTNDFSLDPEFEEQVVKNTDNTPRGAVYTMGRQMGTATIELQDSDQPLPAFGDYFTEDEGTFYIVKVGRTESRGAETKVPITFKGAINPSNVTVT